MIAIADYGLGNVRAFVNIYRQLNLDVVAASEPAQLAAADHIVLPGVGAFDWAMNRLDASGLRGALDEAVLERKVPVLGVCVGMQMMTERSEEGSLPGLSWISGEVRRLDSILPHGANAQTELPHMGWNDVTPAADSSLFAGLDDIRCYFLHSYAVFPSDPAHVLATTDYGARFTSAVRAGHIHATQFHPEKSHEWGVAILRNFAAA